MPADDRGDAQAPYRVRMLRHLPKGGVVAEVGVWQGDYSAVLLRELRPRELHLVDPWVFQPDYGARWYGGGAARSQDDMDAIHRGVVDRFAGAPEVRVHRGRSTEVLEGFADDSLDLAYIDGNHSFEYVLQDFVVAFRKLRRGGFLCGDDWLWKDEHGRTSVREAVLAFLQMHVIDFLHVQEGQVLLRRP